MKHPKFREWITRFLKKQWIENPNDCVKQFHKKYGCKECTVDMKFQFANNRFHKFVLFAVTDYQKESA